MGRGRAALFQRGVDEAADDAVAVDDHPGDPGSDRIVLTDLRIGAREIPPLDGTLPPLELLGRQLGVDWHRTLCRWRCRLSIWSCFAVPRRARRRVRMKRCGKS